MFELVADIESYPGFLPWCVDAKVHNRDPEMVEATLRMAKGPLRKSLTTRNRMRPPEIIEVGLLRGPFSRLQGLWRFEPAPGGGARISLGMEFEINNVILRRTLGPLFGEIANSMVDAFCRRAREVYGGRSP